MLCEVIATSNSPYLYRPTSVWRQLHATQLTDGVPTPNDLADETDEGRCHLWMAPALQGVI